MSHLMCMSDLVVVYAYLISLGLVRVSLSRSGGQVRPRMGLRVDELVNPNAAHRGGGLAEWSLGQEEEDEDDVDDDREDVQVSSLTRLMCTYHLPLHLTAPPLHTALLHSVQLAIRSIAPAPRHCPSVALCPSI